MTILLSDPRVAAVPVRDTGDQPVLLQAGLSHGDVWVRAGLAVRLAEAATALPDGVRLHVVEGWRPAAQQSAIITRYTAELRRRHPDAGDAELRVLASRFVAPLEVAPHVAGAAVDLTLVTADGAPLDLGTEVDATPEQSGGRCYTGSDLVVGEAREHRELMARALGGAGLVNYPTEWWHWSFGDRYWALVTGAPAALYGPMVVERAA
ncbi:M15 family metallopeptidase [Nocardioides nanhaiensis]|uniref:D-alanyl-D-alanine dipeptidase n=1 Tax=Nocardioides nanhaiensis TaxID=1476871 RepID=A0ABP8VY68_9ACTN